MRPLNFSRLDDHQSVIIPHFILIGDGDCGIYSLQHQLILAGRCKSASNKWLDSSKLRHALAVQLVLERDRVIKHVLPAITDAASSSDSTQSIFEIVAIGEDYKSKEESWQSEVDSVDTRFKSIVTGVLWSAASLLKTSIQLWTVEGFRSSTEISEQTFTPAEGTSVKGARPLLLAQTNGHFYSVVPVATGVCFSRQKRVDRIREAALKADEELERKRKEKHLERQAVVQNGKRVRRSITRPDA